MLTDAFVEYALNSTFRYEVHDGNSYWNNDSDKQGKKHKRAKKSRPEHNVHKSPNVIM